MADIGNLVVKLQAQTDAFKRKMNDAKSAVDRFSKDAQSKLDAVKTGFNVLAKGVGLITKALVAGAGVAAGFFAAMTVKAGTIKSWQQLADVTGVSVENLQKWQIAGKSVGIEADKMGDIMRDAAEKLGELAATGGGEAKEVFEKLGLDAREFANIPVDQALLRIAERMDGLTKNERNALFEMMASDARELIPLLENNAEKFKQVATEAENIGAILSSDAVAGAVTFRESWDDLVKRAGAFTTQLTAKMAPVLETLIRYVTEWVDKFGGMDKVAERVAKFMINMLTNMVKGTVSFIKALGNVEAGWKKIQKAIIGVGETAAEVLNFFTPSTWAQKFGVNFKDTAVQKFEKNLEGTRKMLQDEINELENADPAQYPIVKGLNDLLTKLEGSVGKATGAATPAKTSGSKGGKTLPDVTDMNTLATEKNTAALETYSQSILSDRAPEGGFKRSTAFEGLIKRFRTIAGTGQQGPRTAESFSRAARTIIAQMESAGGYDTEKARQQMEAMLERINKTSKEDMRNMLGGDGQKSIGSITITVKKDDGTMSGEVTGDTGFLEKLANALQGVSTSAGRTA